jgi:hypothetical protein
LEDIDVKRGNKWTESIAVGSGPFIERIKTAMGAMAKGGSVKHSAGAFELRETQSAYSSIFHLGMIIIANQLRDAIPIVNRGLGADHVSSLEGDINSRYQALDGFVGAVRAYIGSGRGDGVVCTYQTIALRMSMH